MKNSFSRFARRFCLVPLAALGLAVLPAQGQMAPAPATSASMPKGHMQMGKPGSADMKQMMMTGMEGMHKMTMTGDTDKDFAMMMKMHHQQGVEMARMQLAHGKSADMKRLAKNIISSQNKEIAQFDSWLAKQK